MLIFIIYAGLPVYERRAATPPITVSIKAKIPQRDLIDQAAQQLGQSRADFMLAAACREAEDVLLDQIQFPVDG